jgi:nucleotide-binding universal stress UspA family protein
MTTSMKVLVAYDGSPGADAALDDLKRAGMPDVVEALVVSVAELWLPPPSATFKPVLTSATELLPAPVEAARNLALEASRRLQTIFPAWDVRAEGLVGSPASAALIKADEWKPNLIVVGSHGRSALGRFMLGSVSQKIVTEAHCSVRVARGLARQSALSRRECGPRRARFASSPSSPRRSRISRCFVGRRTGSSNAKPKRATGSKSG